MAATCSKKVVSGATKDCESCRKLKKTGNRWQYHDWVLKGRPQKDYSKSFCDVSQINYWLWVFCPPWLEDLRRATLSTFFGICLLDFGLALHWESYCWSATSFSKFILYGIFHIFPTRHFGHMCFYLCDPNYTRVKLYDWPLAQLWHKTCPVSTDINTWQNTQNIFCGSWCLQDHILSWWCTHTHTHTHV